jgi:DNA mismatch repair protein MutS2
VLDTLLRKNAWGVATTHYYNLKVFAGQTAGIRNGAMRFDEQALKPLYIMDMGKPGSSFALEIARQTGLPEQTLHTAGELVGKELLGFERLIRELEREKQLLANRIAELEQKEAAMQQALKKYEHLAHDLEVRKKDIIAKSKQEAQQLLRETNREIEKTIRHIRENQAQQNETRRVRKNLETLAQRVSSDVQPPKIVTGETVKAGDIVRLIGQEGSGTLISVKGKSALVQFGEIKTTVRLDKLEKSSGPRQPISQSPARNNLAIYKKQATFTPVLDVRGKRVEEVISLVDQFMDTAILLSQGELRIIHGKGEGVLRKVIREHLRKYSQLASMADEHADRGGDGVTIVVLK